MTIGIKEQVWNHLVTMLVDFGILQETNEDVYFNPDVNVDEHEIISREFLHTYSAEQIHSWHKVVGCTFDRGSNFFRCTGAFPRRYTKVLSTLCGSSPL